MLNVWISLVIYPFKFSFYLVFFLVLLCVFFSYLGNCQCILCLVVCNRCSETLGQSPSDVQSPLWQPFIENWKHIHFSSPLLTLELWMLVIAVCHCGPWSFLLKPLWIAFYAMMIFTHYTLLNTKVQWTDCVNVDSWSVSRGGGCTRYRWWGYGCGAERWSWW